MIRSCSWECLGRVEPGDKIGSDEFSIAHLPHPGDMIFLRSYGGDGFGPGYCVPLGGRGMVISVDTAMERCTVLWPEDAGHGIKVQVQDVRAVSKKLNVRWSTEAIDDSALYGIELVHP